MAQSLRKVCGDVPVAEAQATEPGLMAIRWDAPRVMAETLEARLQAVYCTELSASAVDSPVDHNLRTASRIQTLPIL